MEVTRDAVDAHLLLGSALAAQGRPGEAREAFEEARRIDPEAALRRLQGATARHPDSRALLSAYADALEETGRLEEALTAREANYARHVGDPVAQNDLAWSLAVAGKEMQRVDALAAAAVAELERRLGMDWAGSAAAP